MARINSDEAEREGILDAARLMAVSSRTSPKTRGMDSTKTLILHGAEELEALARAMEKRYEDDPERLAFFKRNADDVRKSTAVLIIGVTGEPKKVEIPLDCGACGHNCQAILKAKKIDAGDASGPMCHFQSMDLGIALASAVKTASDFNVDNRMMYSIGAAARRMNLMDADLAIGIPAIGIGEKRLFYRPVARDDIAQRN